MKNKGEKGFGRGRHDTSIALIDSSHACPSVPFRCTCMMMIQIPGAYMLWVGSSVVDRAERKETKGTQVYDMWKTGNEHHLANKVVVQTE